MTAPYSGPVYNVEDEATPFQQFAEELVGQKNRLSTGIAWSLSQMRTEKQRETAKAYLVKLKAQGHGVSRAHKTVHVLAQFAAFLDIIEFHDGPKAAIERFCQERQFTVRRRRHRVNGMPYYDIRQQTVGDDTLNRRRYYLRNFYWDLVGKKAGDELFENIQCGSVTPKPLSKKDLVTPDEFGQLMRQAKHDCDKALLTTMAESGMRIGALIALNVEDVHDEADGPMVLRVNPPAPGLQPPQPPKRVDWSAPFIRAWLARRPNPSPEAPLFPNVRRAKGKRLTSGQVDNFLRSLCGQAGIRELHPHMFRRTAATDLARDGMPTKLLNNVFGWSGRAKTASRYVVLSNADVKAAQLQNWGISTENLGVRSLLQPLTCPRCGHAFPVDAKFCPNCQSPIKEEYRGSAGQEEARRAAQLDHLVSLLLPQLEEIQRKSTTGDGGSA